MFIKTTCNAEGNNIYLVHLVEEKYEVVSNGNPPEKYKYLKITPDAFVHLRAALGLNASLELVSKQLQLWTAHTDIDYRVQYY